MWCFSPGAKVMGVKCAWFCLALTPCLPLGPLRSMQAPSGSPALPRKQRDKSPSDCLEDPREPCFTRDRKGGFFSSFMKKRSAPAPPKRSSSFREMENQPHKRYELATGCGPPDGAPLTPAQSDAAPGPRGLCASDDTGGSAATAAGGWSGLSGFFTPRLIKKTLGLRAGKPAASEDTAKPFPRSNSTSSMSSGLPEQDRMTMTLPRNCQRARLQLDRTVAAATQPEDCPDKASDALPRRAEGGVAPARDRSRAKLLHHGTTEKDPPAGLPKAKERNGARPGPEDGELAGWAPSGTTHSHKVPVLISPTLKHSPADVQLIGTDSQGNKFKLLSEHQAAATATSGDKDRPRRVKPKCAPPPPPVMRLEEPAAPATAEVPEAGRRSGPAAGKAGRPALPPPQVPLPAPTVSPAKMANGTAGTKVTLRKTRPVAEKVPAEKISKEALLECADLLSSAIAEPLPNSQLVDTGHQLLGYCSGYVDCIPQTRNKFAFREAVSKLELSLQELQVSPAAAGDAGANPVLSHLLSCVQEISDVVQR